MRDKTQNDPRFFRVIDKKDMGLYKRVVEMHDDGIFVETRVRYIAKEATQEAHDAASSASFDAFQDNPPKHDAITSPKARRKTIEELETIREKAGYSAMRNAAKRCARDAAEAKGTQAQLKAFRARDAALAKADVNMEAITEAQRALYYLARVPANDGEDAFRAGYAYAKALALLRAPGAQNGKKMNQKDAASNGRNRKKSEIRKRFDEAFSDWFAEGPHVSHLDFWP